MLKLILTISLVCNLALIDPQVITGSDLETVGPSFSFWRNLPERVSTYQEPGQVLAPLELAVAARCCSVRPGQTVTLVREGKPLAAGQISDIFAAKIPQAGDDRTVFFEVSGFSDSLNVGSGPPPYARLRDSAYDLFVVGEVLVEPMSPGAHGWSESVSLTNVVNEAVSAKLISRSELLHGYSSYGREGAISPDSLAIKLGESCDLLEYSILVGSHGPISVQTIKHLTEGVWGGIYPTFVRVSFGTRSEHTLLSGILDYFLKIDGVPYMVLRSGKYGSGAWGYSIYRLNSSKPPERIHSDGSWST